VDDAVSRVKAQADPEAEVRVSIAKEYTAKLPSSTPGSEAKTVPVSDINVKVVPPAGALKESDFAGLDAEINKRPMSLKDIRDYRPSPPTNLRIQ
jgi:hypothetical protein